MQQVSELGRPFQLAGEGRGEACRGWQLLSPCHARASWPSTHASRIPCTRHALLTPTPPAFSWAAAGVAQAGRPVPPRCREGCPLVLQPVVGADGERMGRLYGWLAWGALQPQLPATTLATRLVQRSRIQHALCPGLGPVEGAPHVPDMSVHGQTTCYNPPVSHAFYRRRHLPVRVPGRVPGREDQVQGQGLRT